MTAEEVVGLLDSDSEDHDISSAYQKTRQQGGVWAWERVVKMLTAELHGKHHHVFFFPSERLCLLIASMRQERSEGFSTDP